MKIQINRQEISFTLTGKNTLTAATPEGGSWEVRFGNDIIVGQYAYLGPKRRVPMESPYHYPAARFAGEIRRHFGHNMSIIGSDLQSFLDRFSPINTMQVA